MTSQAEVSRLRQTLDQRTTQLEESRVQETKLNERRTHLESEITGESEKLLSIEKIVRLPIHMFTLHKDFLIWIVLQLHTAD